MRLPLISRPASQIHTHKKKLNCGHDMSTRSSLALSFVGIILENGRTGKIKMTIIDDSDNQSI